MMRIATWSSTTEEIIHGYNPVVICFCEVGEVMNPLEANNVEVLQEATCRTWRSCNAAAEHVEFLHTHSALHQRIVQGR